MALNLSHIVNPQPQTEKRFPHLDLDVGAQPVFT